VFDYIGTMFSGDIATASFPLFFQVCHSVFLGCVLRPITDNRLDGKGRRWWLASVVLHLVYIYGGCTITAVFLGNRPVWMFDNVGWILYALGWFLGGFNKVCHFVLETPAKFMFLVGHALSRVIFVSGAVTAAAEACPGGFLAAIAVPVMNCHFMDWLTVPLFIALEGKPLTDCKDWITPSAGLRNTFWAALLYYVFSGKAFGMLLPEHLSFLLANAGVAAPLVYDAVFNGAFMSNTSILGFLEAIFSTFVAFVESFREKMNNKKAEDISVVNQEDKKEV